eukprot:CAMPEP_0202450004 /NCGR_PEP_ID=MMETSP1360-20130828/8666_1 /ASSEMBLY_ACC=CAM_ASM_000848 /TAXON_ID=515479 /ORGANISM="Licmophora paradoxa, Strain CCMP2313" /LENGTH=58 /DNA_ID=CAMNT_0049068115 /DNA_START=776 /DNA_END=952 /DNA_ORIENTATION=+
MTTLGGMMVGSALKDEKGVIEIATTEIDTIDTVNISLMGFGSEVVVPGVDTAGGLGIP